MSIFCRILIFFGLTTYSIGAICAVIPNGGSVNGTIRVDGESHTHYFEGFSGQEGLLSISGNVSSGETYFAFNPDGTLLTKGTGPVLVALTQTGTYTIVIRSTQYYGTGDYEVHVALAPGANEHGQIANGSSKTESLDSNGEIDSFTFYGTAGDGGVISISGDVSSGETYFVFNPDGTLLTKGTGPVRVALTQTGTYTIVTRSTQYYGTGDYEVHVALAPGANEHGLITSGSSKTESLDSNGEIDSFTFHGSAGDGGVISISGDVSSGETFFVFNPDGTLLTQGTGPVRVELTQTGTYTIVTRSTQYYGTGDYEVHVALAPGANEHGLITSGSSKAESIDSNGEIDSFTFHGTAGDGGVISISGDVSSGETYFVFNPDGTLLTQGTGPVRVELTQTGTYTIVTRSTQYYGTGDYEVHVALAPGDTEYGDITRNGSATQMIDEGGDIDSFSFAGLEGDVGEISLSGDNAGAQYMYLFGPDGSFLGAGYSIELELSVSGNYMIVVRSTQGYRTGSFTLDLTMERDVLSYAALGDSYSSGEGVFPYIPPSDINGCHRSFAAYSTLLRLPDELVPLAGKPDTIFDFLACSGAVTNQVKSSGKSNNGESPQLAPTNGVNASRDLVTISIGGNDAYFATILEYCFVHNHCNDLKPFDPHSSIELGDFFAGLAGIVKLRLLELHAEIKSATPNATTLVLGYPIVVGGQECKAVQIPFFENIQLSQDEQLFMQKANRVLNRAIQEAAAEVGLHFVDVAEHFDGHEVCGLQEDWIYGVLPFGPIAPKASFHPNTIGQFEIAEAVHNYLDSIKTGWPHGYFDTGLPKNPPPGLPIEDEPGIEVVQNPPSPDQLPKFGELSLSFVDEPVNCAVLDGIITSGGSFEASGSGFTEFELVQLSLVINNERIDLGTTNADESGNIQVIFHIPESIVNIGAVGVVEALGKGLTGFGQLLFKTVKLVDSTEIDSDLDGIPDGCDNCSQVANADQLDSDSDGFGNSCDVCQAISDPWQEDFNNDGSGDHCTDTDLDSILDIDDACPLEPVADNDENGDGCSDIVDSDSDGIYDSLDNCPDISNPDQSDFNSDGIGDACGDFDNDNVLDIDDACPTDPAISNDQDGDGCVDLGLVGDFDQDNDIDLDDVAILLAVRNQQIADDDPRDLDGDGVVTALDARRLTLMCTRPRCARE